MELTLDLLEGLMSQKGGYLFSFHDSGDGYWLVETQNFFPDGDPYLVYVMGNENGDFLITDRGHTQLHLSYESENIPIFSNIVIEKPLQFRDGELVFETSASMLEANLVRYISEISVLIDSQNVKPLT